MVDITAEDLIKHGYEETLYSHDPNRNYDGAYRKTFCDDNGEKYQISFFYYELTSFFPFQETINYIFVPVLELYSTNHYAPQSYAHIKFYKEMAIDEVEKQSEAFWEASGKGYRKEY